MNHTLRHYYTATYISIHTLTHLSSFASSSSSPSSPLQKTIVTNYCVILNVGESGWNPSVVGTSIGEALTFSSNSYAMCNIN